MVEFEDLKNGWDFMAQILAAGIGAESAFSQYAQNIAQNKNIENQNIRIKEINEAIDKLQQSINNHSHLNLNVEQLKGYIAEEMHAGTFNIEAIRQGSSHRAWTLHENGYGSVDIQTNFGKEYSLKYSNAAKAAENMQAELNRESHTPKYQGQERLIAAEQLDKAKELAQRRTLKNMYTRPDVSYSHADTGKHLVGTVSDGEGVESKKLSVKGAKQIAEEAKNGEFDPEKYRYKKDPFIEKVRINYVNQALKAGLTAASITAIMQIVPELYKSVDYLIKTGEIDLNKLRQSGKRLISSSGEAFLRGSIAYGIEMAIMNGFLGEAIKVINPSVVGALVTVIFGTIKDSIYVAAGKLSAEDMGMHFVDTLVVSSGYLASMNIGGTVAQALFPELPGIGYAIGSLLGCSVAIVYNVGKKKLISFCVDTGFTCFGLVEQNYEIPEKVLNEMGIHTIQVPRTEVKRMDIECIHTHNLISTVNYETINITMLKRGIIGVNKVGYAF